MTRECSRVGGINLGQGICDMPTPPEILNATHEAISNELSVYSRYDGVAELRQQIALKMEEDSGRATDPEREVVVTIGATGAFAATCQALFDPEDEIILFEPYYGYHLNTLKVSGQVPKFITLQPPSWTVTRAMLEAAHTPKTRAIVVNTPTNPSGKIFTRTELETIAAFCQDHDILAVTDEIYEYILYDNAEHIHLATIDGMHDRCITISGFSKTFSITGWRLGYALAVPEIASTIGLVNDLFYVCAPTPLQHGVAHGMAALRGSSYYTDLRASYQLRRDRFCAALKRAGLPPVVPQGAYYVLANVERLGLPTAHQASMHILETVGVASVPGSAFFRGEEGERFVRFCFAKQDDVLDEAIARLGRLA